MSKHKSFTLTKSSIANSYRNPANGYEITIRNAGLWCLLFGCFYFAYKGAWGLTIISAVAAIATVGISWLIFPFVAKKLLSQHFGKIGWEEIEN